MVAKTLIKISTDEYAHIQYGEIFTCSLPMILPMSCTIELLKEYYKNSINFNDLQLIQIEITRL